MSSTGLARLQAALHAHLLDRSASIVDEVADGGRISVDQRLRIYRHAYRARLLECLQEAHEKTWAYLGDGQFDAAALAFIEANPPYQRNLRWYGSTFAQWLASRFPGDPDIAELALIDWQLRQAFDGPDADPLAAEDLAGLSVEDWAGAGFRLCPTLSITPVRTNSASIWHALDQQRMPPAAEPLPGPAWLMIWRKGWQPHFRTLEAAEHAALLQVRRGATFSGVCAELSERATDREAAGMAAAWLQTWLRDELIVGLT